jgi:hypothetical protein
LRDFGRTRFTRTAVAWWTLQRQSVKKEKKVMYRHFRNLAIKLVLAYRIAGMLLRYRRGQEPIHKEWENLMRLHCMTNGASTGAVRRAMTWLNPSPASPHPFDSLFGKFDADAMAKAAEQIRRDGYYLLPGRIPEAICDEIADNVRSYPGWTWYDHSGPHTVAQFDPEHLTAPRYVLPEPEIWRIKAYQRIIADPIFVNLSQAYFGAAPALKEAGLWWSPATNVGTPDAIAAQMFHFDFDAAPIWLKFFVYLNDIGPENGPHVFVKGSNRLGEEISREILSRGYVRISDEEITAKYGAENVLEMTGRKGTVFAVDTMGFHKGKLPVAGHRLLAQLEFATALFIPTRSKPLPLPVNAIPALLAAQATYPWAYARFPAAGRRPGPNENED